MNVRVAVFPIITAILATLRAADTSSCNKDTDCDTEGEHMTCFKNTCVCDENLGLIRESHSNSCAILVGRACFNSSIPCVSLAQCDPGTGTCHCDGSDVSVTVYSTCALEHGHPCDFAPPFVCNPFKFLRCAAESRRCTCVDDDAQVYDPSRGICVGKPGQSCDLNRYEQMQLECSSNASCDPINSHYGKCTCNTGFTSSGQEDFCKPMLGTPCDLADQEMPCAHGQYLNCIPNSGSGSGICACAGDAILDPDLGQCLPKPGVFCKFPTQTCVPNAKCSPEFKCVCNAGHSKTLDGSCKLRHGQACEDDLGLICNDHELLTCNRHTRTCHCLSNLKFNGTRCVAPVNEACSPAENVFCAMNSECTAGQCQCRPNHYAQIDGNCHPGFGETCNSQSFCNPGDHLICQQGICSCDERIAISDSKLSKCRLRAGRACNEILSSDTCTRNAVCEDRKCQCTKGLEVTREGLCKLGYNQMCNSWIIPTECNEDAQLRCINSTCSCTRDEVFEPSINLCVGLAGSECKLRVNDCVPNSQCIALDRDVNFGICTCKPNYEIRGKGLCTKATAPTANRGCVRCILNVLYFSILSKLCLM